MNIVNPFLERLLRQPEFDPDGFFTVTFRRSPDFALKQPQRLVERLAETKRKILALMRENPAISKRKLAAKIGISTTAIDKNIASLKAKSLLRRIGPDKGGRWEAAGPDMASEKQPG